LFETLEQLNLTLKQPKTMLFEIKGKQRRKIENCGVESALKNSKIYFLRALCPAPCRQ
jgi:hypothetical protein